MCGRYTLTSSGEALARHFDLEPGRDGDPPGIWAGLHPRYNIAPSQWVPVVRSGVTRRVLALHRWGLVPFWAPDPSIGARLVNARAETAASKPAFRSAMRTRRCLVPMDGFYEWRRRGRARLPVWFHPRKAGLLAAAGLWEEWQDPEGEVLRSFTILTTEADRAVAPVHDRMPVFVARDEHARWLDPEQRDPAALADLLAARPDHGLEGRAVSRCVNDPRNDGPECLEPEEPGEQSDLFAPE